MTRVFLKDERNGTCEETHVEITGLQNDLYNNRAVNPWVKVKLDEGETGQVDARQILTCYSIGP